MKDPTNLKPLEKKQPYPKMSKDNINCRLYTTENKVTIDKCSKY